MERVEKEYPMVVAMWGAPCTGKTTIAKGVAAKLQCPLLSFDYFLDQIVSWSSTPSPPNLFPSSLLRQRPPMPYFGERWLSFAWRKKSTKERKLDVVGVLPDLFRKLDVHPEPTKELMSYEEVQQKSADHEDDHSHKEDDANVEQQCSSASPPSTANEESMAAKKLMDRAFSLAVQLVETHLRMGISVIIDSVFLHSYLKQLASLKTSHPGVKIVVVSCQPSEWTQWENMFFIRQTSSDRNKWYKPRSPAYFEILSHYYALGYDFPRASILEVNTSYSLNYEKLVRVLRDLSCARGHRVKLDAWKPIHYKENDETDQGGVDCTLKMDRERLPYDDATHGMLDFHNKLPKSLQRGCGDCAQLIIDEEAYTCRCGCDLVLHKLCAHSSKRGYDTPGAGMDLHTFSKLLRERWLGPKYPFPEKHICKQCRETHKDFSYDCPSCFSETFQKYFPERDYYGN